MSITIPPALARNAVEAWADDGVRWLARLPALIDEVARDLNLTLGAPYQLSFHWVTSVTRADGSAAVLKLGVPAGHLSHQAQALHAYGGHGAVRLLAHDPKRGALLLERADPGSPAAALVQGDDEEAAAALVTVGRRLHLVPPAWSTLPDLREESELLYNPEPWRREGDLLALVPARIEQLADGFGIPVDRIVAWGFVMGVLSEVWTAQGDGTPGSRALDVATMLYPRLS